jgi:hypothetical protein
MVFCRLHREVAGKAFAGIQILSLGIADYVAINLVINKRKLIIYEE